jgi:hypothetical protein
MDIDACQGGYNRVIHSKGQDVIRTVITYCDEEARNKYLLLPVQRAPAIQVIYNSPVLYSPKREVDEDPVSPKLNNCLDEQPSFYDAVSISVDLSHGM